MCGIAGILTLPGHTVDRADLQAMGEALTHRGPDCTGIDGRGHYGCAHTRLSIIDLSDNGNQPFQNERYSLAYNGEIYNYRELRQQLEGEGVRFVGTSDTEVLFHALICYGVENTLKRIRGMFAFSFYDQTVDIVYLCRDRFGIKPLHWCYKGGVLYWASEIKAIAAVVAVEPHPVQVLWSAASMGENSNFRTMFKGVYNVGPGTYLTAQSGEEPVSHRYYDICDEMSETDYKALGRLSFAEVTERFDSLLQRSVERMLMSDAPMGAFVSGGVDSSLIAAYARQHNTDLQLFTANVVGKYSEVEDARLLSQSIHAPLHEVTFRPERMLSQWARATYHYEVPIVRHTNAIPFADVASLAHSQGVKAVLTGEGADELFLGYTRSATRLYERIAFLPLNLLKKLYSVIPRIYQYVFPSPAMTVTTFTRQIVQNFEEQRLSEQLEQTFTFLPPQQRELQRMTLSSFCEHLITLLHRNDRMGMQGSIEARFPFLDEELVHFGVNLPARFKIEQTHRFHDYAHPFLLDKAIIRLTAKRVLPDRIALKRKNGFPLYGHNYMRFDRQFFKSGYVQELAGLSGEALDYMLEESGKTYFIGKFASIEVFGRLFAYRQSADEVTQHILKFASMNID